MAYFSVSFPAPETTSHNLLRAQAKLRARKMLTSLIDPTRDRFLRGLFHHLRLDEHIAALMVAFYQEAAPRSAVTPQQGLSPDHMGRA
jgi:hypothetical protein